MDNIEKIKLTTGEEITLRTTPLTWGEREVLKYFTLNSFNKDRSFNPQGMFEAQVEGVKVMIVKITKDGKDVPFSREWLTALSVEDGESITEAINKIHEDNDKKKSQLAEAKS